jgi:hypothetical protein
LGARFDGNVLWRGGELERLMDERHSLLDDHSAGIYRHDGWETLPEVTFQHFGERGSIDLLCLHPGTRSAAVNEMKSDIPSVEETHRRHDVKVRLAARIVEERFGWRPLIVARILVLPEESRRRRIVESRASVFRAAYPATSREIRAWIREPSGPMAGIWFLSPTDEERRNRVPGGARRIRLASARTKRGEDAA